MDFLVAKFRWTFAAFVIVGAGVILVFSNVIPKAEDKFAAHWLMMGSVVGLMVFFGLIVWKRSRTTYASDTDAELFYYLGFIYTLITLVATFTPLLAGGDALTTQHVLGLFGLGLVTTFVGLAGRVFFLHSDRPAAVEEGSKRLEIAYQDLTRQVESVGLQMGRVAAELEKAAKHSHQVISTSAERLIEKAIQETTKMMREASDSTLAHMRQVAEAMAEIIQKAATDIEKLTREIGDRLDALKLPSPELGKQLTKRIEALNQSSAAVNTSMLSFNEVVAGATAELTNASQAAAQTADHVRALRSEIASTTTELGRANSALGDANSRSAALAETLRESTSAVETFGSSAIKTAESLKDVPAHVDAFESAMKMLGNTSVAASPQIAELSQRLLAMSEHVSALLLAIKETAELGKSLHAWQKQTGAELGNGVETLRRHQMHVEQLSRQLTEDLAASELALRKVHTNLINATEFVISKVQ